MMTAIVALVVSAALLIGAAWGIYGKLGSRTEGFLIALAGGALIVSVISELIEPALDNVSVLPAIGFIFLGAAVFTAIDYLVDEHWGSNSGGGLLVAITLDGIPENLALGVALIGAGPAEVAALAGAIFLSNLPEAAGGARDMRKDGSSKVAVLGVWAATALLLSLAAIVGNLALKDASPASLGLIRCFAAGAVVASLALEVFPKAYKEDRHLAGIATAVGLCLALALSQLSAS